MNRVVEVMKALGERNRFRITLMVSQRPLCVCEICSVLEISISTVSSHLKQLAQAGILTGSREGRWVTYSLSDDPLVRRLLNLVGEKVRDEELMVSDRRRVKSLDREACALSLRGGKVRQNAGCC